jgi:Protein of unknown function (DUF3465)
MLPLTLAFALLWVSFLGGPPQSARAQSRPTSESDRVLGRAFEQHTSSLQVEGRGVVRRILPDDNDGSRHQRFILELGSGQTLLVAHNVDIAPRINGVRKGDRVAFRGEYEWNEEGGVVHWTHHDPGGRHPGGWLKHKGKTYQ